jgi:hypothetical protein
MYLKTSLMGPVTDGEGVGDQDSEIELIGPTLAGA